jgi:hypothetical protein
MTMMDVMRTDRQPGILTWCPSVVHGQLHHLHYHHQLVRSAVDVDRVTTLPNVGQTPLVTRLMMMMMTMMMTTLMILVETMQG